MTSIKGLKNGTHYHDLEGSDYKVGDTEKLNRSAKRQIKKMIKKQNSFLHDVVWRFKFECEVKCGITGNYNELEYVTWCKEENEALDRLMEEYPTARGIFITKTRAI